MWSWGRGHSRGLLSFALPVADRRAIPMPRSWLGTAAARRLRVMSLEGATASSASSVSTRARKSYVPAENLRATRHCTRMFRQPATGPVNAQAVPPGSGRRPDGPDSGLAESREERAWPVRPRGLGAAGLWDPWDQRGRRGSMVTGPGVARGSKSALGEGVREEGNAAVHLFLVVSPLLGSFAQPLSPARHVSLVSRYA